MNALNNSSDEVVECPLCMEPLEADDLNFYPCTCGYQICRFCWHRIRTDENELCPACRKAYPENPADFKPLSQEQIAALKAEKRQRDQQRKQKITENRKHLANVRVVQKNLVFVVGLPPRLADADILKKHEYFGKYGKIHKVVINPSTAYAGIQGPSASAYVTYVHNNDALRAIQSVNNIVIDGRLIKTSLGTTKYCSHFMKNQQCPKGDCMYLHELGDPEASFTKEEMHQGKHQEYEKRLHDALIASSNGSVTTQNCKNGDNKLGNGTGSVQTTKEAWPSLSVSPTNTKEEQQQQQQNKTGKGKGNKDGGNRKHDKSRGDKKGKNQKNRNDNNSKNNNNNNSNENISSHATTNGLTNGTKDSSQTNDSRTAVSTVSSSEKHSKQNNQQSKRLSADEEVNLIDDLDKDTSSDDNDANNGDMRSLSSSSSNSSSNGDSASLTESSSGKSSPGSFPDHRLSQTPESQPITTPSPTSDTQGSLSSENSISNQQSTADTNSVTNSVKSEGSVTTTTTSDVTNILDTSACLSKLSLFDDNNSFFSTSTFEQLFKDKLDNENRTAINNQINNASSQLPDLLNGIDGYQNHNNTSSSILAGLNGLGGLGSLGSSSVNSSNHSSNSSSINSPSTTTTTSNTSSSSFIDNPDKYMLSSMNMAEEWEQALKYLMMRNSKQMEDQQHQQQQEEFLRLQELQKRNLINSMGMTQPPQQQPQQQPSYLHDFNGDFLHNGGGTDMNRLSQQSHMFQQHQQHQQQQRQLPNGLNPADHGGSIFGTNMSKFFDFHKNQQQQMQHQQFLMNGYGNNMLNDHRDHLSMAALLENRMNPHNMDHTNGLIGQQLQKQRMFNKFDQIGSHNSQNMLMNPNSNSNSNLQQQHQQQNRIHNQFMHNAPVDDDLGFDPFFETQKALAELMENEQSQNNHNKHLLESCQRSRMPPPGFNHMNAFGFGIPRAQGSKILPFMNSSQQQMPQQQNNWPHMGGFPQPPQQQQPPNPGAEQQMHMGQPPNQNLNKSGGYGSISSDWTAMDPAILSFRQFPSYSSHQQHTPDMFMQHLNQQTGQGFGHHGQNLPNNLMNQQQQQQQQQQPNSAQVNYSHSNWFNNSAEQSMFMNSLGNGGYSNNYEKFSLPPGIHINNMNNCISGNKQQKTECIN